MVLFDWKSIFTLGLVALLGWYLLTTEGGKSYIESIKSKLGDIGPFLNAGGKKQVETGNVSMQMSVQKSLFDNKEFDVENSAFGGTGTCDLNVTVINIPGEEVQSISVDLIKAKISLGEDGAANIKGVSNGIQLQPGNKVIPSDDKGFDISVTCQLSNLSVTNIVESKILLEDAQGVVSGDKGTLKLTGDDVEVQGFKGDLRVSSEGASLSGFILKILLNGEKAII